MIGPLKRMCSVVCPSYTRTPRCCCSNLHQWPYVSYVAHDSAVPAIARRPAVCMIASVCYSLPFPEPAAVAAAVGRLVLVGASSSSHQGFALLGGISSTHVSVVQGSSSIPLLACSPLHLNLTLCHSVLCGMWFACMGGIHMVGRRGVVQLHFIRGRVLLGLE